jgi:hypothetical protein
VERAIGRGLEFVERHLIAADGRLVEKAVLADEEDRRTRALLYRGHDRWEIGGERWIVRLPAEARTWSYGALLRTFGDAAERGIVPVDPALRLLARLYRHQLRSPAGRFGYRAGDARVFPRHEAHLFDGLCALLPAV